MRLEVSGNPRVFLQHVQPMLGESEAVWDGQSHMRNSQGQRLQQINVIPKFLAAHFLGMIATKGGIHFYNQTARSAMFDHPSFVPNSSLLVQFDSLMNLSWPFIIIYHPNPD